MNDRAQRLAEGSIPSLLVSFSLPAIVGMVAQAFYNIVDRFFIGRALGPDGIAGIAVSLPFMLIILAFSMLIGFGAAALVSLRLGEQKKEEAERVLGHAAVLVVLVSALLTLVGRLFLDQWLVLFGASSQVLPYARDYLGIIVMGSIFQVGSFGLNASIRSEGNPLVAMCTLWIGVLLNFALAPLFIFVFGWGMKGAGLATVLSQAVSMTWVLCHFLGRSSLLKLRWHNLGLSWSVCRKIMAIGSPHCVMQLVASILNGLLNNQLRIHGGDAAISAMGVIYATFMLILMPIFGVNQGVQPIVGYNYGARKFDRVKKAWGLAAIAASTISTAGFVVTMFFPAVVFQIFSPKDEQLLQLGAHAMRVSGAMLPLIGFQIVSASYFQAVGKPRQAILLMLSRQVLLLIPAVIVLPRFLGLDGVWLAMPAADIIASMITAPFIYFEMRSLGT